VSGRECDKFARFGLTPVPGAEVAAPLIAECPVNLECEALFEQRVGDHQLFLGEVLAQHVDEEKLGPDGRPDPDLLDMLAYGEYHYFATGRRIGRHGMSRNRSDGSTN
jgi:flavin reductase (DIM6/NTAB) family NADH-FMN oxidoreductase RutF